MISQEIISHSLQLQEEYLSYTVWNVHVETTFHSHIILCSDQHLFLSHQLPLLDSTGITLRRHPYLTVFLPYTRPLNGDSNKSYESRSGDYEIPSSELYPANAVLPYINETMTPHYLAQSDSSPLNSSGVDQSLALDIRKLPMLSYAGSRFGLIVDSMARNIGC